MNQYMPAIIVALVMIAISALSIWIIHLRHTQEKKKWEQIAADNYARGKDEGDEIVRSTCDKIEEDKLKLADLTDRELLVEMMLALGSLGRRMDRMDNQLKCITNYKAYIDDMNCLIQKLSQRFVTLESLISTVVASNVALRETVQETSSRIHKLVAALGDLSDLHEQINNHVAALGNTEADLEYIQEKVDSIIREMNDVLTTYDHSPIEKLNGIEAYIEEMVQDVSNIQEVLYTLSGTASDIKTTIDGSMEEYDYGSLFYRIADIASKISNVDSEISSVCSKVNDIQSSVDSALSSYGCYSLYSKLDDISSTVNSIRYKVEA